MHLRLNGTAFIATLALFAQSCSPTGGFSTGTLPKKKTDADGSRKLTDIKDRDTSEDDDETVNEPVMVSGAYLVCALDPSVKADKGGSGAGCRIQNHQTGQKMTIPPQVDAQIAVYDVFNISIESSIAYRPAADRWHWTFEIPSKELAGAKAEARLVHKPTGVGREYVAPIDGAPPPTVHLEELGAVGDFHLGDNNFSTNANYGCVDQLQRIEYSGKILHVPFTVSPVGAKVGISFEGICGINRSTNYTALMHAGKDVEVKLFSKNAPTMVMAGFAAESGEYLIEIEASVESSDYDDFIIGKIVLSTDGNLAIGQVSAIAAPPRPTPNPNEPTSGATVEPTAAPTGNPRPRPSRTPLASSTPQPSATPKPSPSPSPAPSPSAQPSATPAPQVSFTPTPSASPSP